MDSYNEMLKSEISSFRELGHKFLNKEVSVGDFKGLAKIIFSLERNDMYEKIKNSGIKKSSLYDIKITAQKYINLYKRLVTWEGK